MSREARDWAWVQKDITAPEKLVLLALAEHADDAGVCYPGANRLGKRCNLARTTVVGHVNTLERAGLLKKEARVDPETGRTTSNRYFLAIPQVDGGSVGTPTGSVGTSTGSVGTPMGGVSAGRTLSSLNRHKEPSFNHKRAGELLQTEKYKREAKRIGQ